jgi:GTP-binding protein
VNIDAAFVTSAADARGFPQDDLAEIALAGRSNVGKSSLINALVRQRLARTSAAPGKTRLANIYRVARGSRDRVYLVDLPGYGYARRHRGDGANPGQRDGVSDFDALTRAVFDRRPAVLLLVDARHPGLPSDVEAWRWLHSAAEHAAIVATKIDKLTRGERTRATRDLESVFDAPVLPVSAVTGEGLDELWKLIEQLTSSSNSSPRPRRGPLPEPAAATAPRPQKKAPRLRKRSSGSTSRRSRT